MLVDTHTNLMWYPDHLSEEFVEFAYEAKKAKMRLSPDVYFAGDEVACLFTCTEKHRNEYQCEESYVSHREINVAHRLGRRKHA